MRSSEQQQVKVIEGHPGGRDGQLDLLYQKVLYGLIELSSRFEAARQIMAHRFALSGPQYSIMMAVARHGERAYCSAVASLLCVSPAFITAEVGKLVEMGLLEKWRRPGDGRLLRLRLTQKAMALVERDRALLQLCNDRTYSGLTKKELAVVQRAIESLSRGADAAFHIATMEWPRPDYSNPVDPKDYSDK